MTNHISLVLKLKIGPKSIATLGETSLQLAIFWMTLDRAKTDRYSAGQNA